MAIGYGAGAAAQAAAAAKKKAADVKAAADKAKITAWATPRNLTTDIINRANNQDPTAGGQTLTTSVLSPLTGKPVVANVGTAGNFSAGGLNADFQGNQAQGVAPRLSMSPAIDKNTGRFFVQVLDPSLPSGSAGRKVYIFGDPNNPKAYQWMDYEAGAQYFVQQYTSKGAAGIKQLKQILADKIGRAHV